MSESRIPMISDLRDAFKGRPGLLVGKGPTLDGFDWDSVSSNAVRIGVNEAALLPEARCEFGVLFDKVALDHIIYPPLCMPIIPIWLNATGGLRYGARGNWWTLMEDSVTVGDMEIETPPHCVPERYWSGPTGLWTLGLWGCRDIIAVGFDGYTDRRSIDHAKCIEPYKIAPSVGVTYPPGNFRHTNKRMECAVKRWGLNVEWINPNGR